MNEQDRYIPGVPCWIDTTQPDPEAAVAFYGGLFGWQLEDAMPPEAPGHYFIARLPGGDVAAVASQPEGAPQTATWNTYVWVQDADEAAAKAQAAGGTVLSDPRDVGDSGRMAVLADPDGAAFCVWQAGEHRGAAVVNEAGSLNFNDLHTRDVESAAAFYGAVFGWEVLDIGGGSAWALPGYGDFLEQRTPGMRKGMAPDGRARAIRGRRRERQAHSRRPAGRSRALGGDARRRRRRRDRRADRRVGRPGARAAVRRAVGAHDRHQRSAGRHVHGQQVRA